MKVILDICGVCFIAKDAATAAKVADMLGLMQPISREWFSTGKVLVQGREPHCGSVEITELGDLKPIERKVFDLKKSADRAAAAKDGQAAAAADSKARSGLSTLNSPTLNSP